jgi:hypothetical protein
MWQYLYNMGYFSSTIDLDTCIGNSLNTFNQNFTSLDLNTKELSTISQTRTDFLSSRMESVSADISSTLTFYNFVSSFPNDSVAVMVFSGNNNSFDNADTGIIAGGTGATLAQAPGPFIATGNKRGQFVTDFQETRSELTHVASSDYSVLLNGSSNTISGSNGRYGFIGCGNLNLIAANYSTILCGTSNKLINFYGFACGVNNTNAYGTHSFICGSNNTNSYATAGPNPLTTNSTGSGAYMFGSNGVSYYENQGIYSNGMNNFRSGDSQQTVLLFRDITTSATKIKHMGPVSVNNYNVTLPNFLPINTNVVWNMKLNVVGVTSAGDVSFFNVSSFIIRRTSSSLNILSGGGVYNGLNATKLTLSAIQNYLVVIDVEQTDNKTWYWTALVETLQTRYNS